MVFGKISTCSLAFLQQRFRGSIARLSVEDDSRPDRKALNSSATMDRTMPIRVVVVKRGQDANQMYDGSKDYEYMKNLMR